MDHLSNDINPTGEDIAIISSILLRYQEQLLYGCGHPTCTEITCLTGKINTLSRPVRAYTSRSTRAIALALSRRADPTEHLCPWLPRARVSRSASYAVKNKTVPSAPIDPSSAVQQLCDTVTILRLFNGLENSNLPHISRSNPPANDAKLDCVISELRHCFAYLDLLCISDNIQLKIDVLFAGFRTLFSCLPAATKRAEVFQAFSYTVTHGYRSFMKGGSRDTALDCIKVLDFIHNRSASALVSRLSEYLTNTGEVISKQGGDFHHSDNAVLCSKFCERLVEDSKIDSDVAFDFGLMISWLKKTISTHWNGGSFLSGSALYAALLLSCLLQTADRRWPMEPQRCAPLAVIYAYCEAPPLAKDWIDSDVERRRTHVFSFRYLFRTFDLVDHFRTINHLKMQHAHSNSVKASTLRSRTVLCQLAREDRLKWIEDHYLLINARRGNILQDAFDQVWQRRRAELFRPLRVRLGEADTFEVGHDLGGVQIEFFNLICRELCRDDSPFFVTNRETNLCYFRPCSFQPLYMFELIGLLFSLAIFNGIALPINFPIAFYRHICDLSLDNPDHLAGLWPTTGRSLENILREGVSGLDATFPLEANGLRLNIMPGQFHPDESERVTMKVCDAYLVQDQEHSRSKTSISHPDGNCAWQPPDTCNIVENVGMSWPGWHLYHCSEEAESITSANAATFVSSYVQWLTIDSVRPQWTAFKKGFFTCLDQQTLCTLFTPLTLQELIEGSQTIDIPELMKITNYEGYNASSSYMRSFWAVIKSWSPQKQMELIKFVTAAERIPVGGTRHLTFKITRACPASLDSLPTSSTCFGTLLLPRYQSSAILEAKLSHAIKYGVEGFGVG